MGYYYETSFLLQGHIKGIDFVAICSFFPCSLTVVYRDRQLKSSRADQQNNLFIFQPDFNIEILPKNAIKHLVS